MPGVITFLTDFGQEDAYVAAMKGVTLGIAPAATLVDISHSVPAQDVLAAAYLLGIACPYFPRGTVHIAVVDPGVGTDRRALLLETPHALFLAPDNGALSYVVDAYLDEREKNVTVPPVLPPPLRLCSLPAALKAYALTHSQLFRQPVSQTFHGRDIFAPVAAHLANGLAPDAVGPRVEAVHAFVLPRPYAAGADTTVGAVMHVDHFGNLITNLSAADLPPGRVQIVIGGHRIPEVSVAYQHGGQLLAIIGSSGYLEIATKNGSAAELTGLGRWAEVTAHNA
ncbi:MAG: SAM-dependent chlorinase/fluorinase [Chloroflexi bacterium]|nr:SAM-dependent chlorinase/fluorinase [Chloroflexota bacterium]